MDIRTGSDGAGDDREQPLVDVTQMPLPDLLAPGNRVLDGALRRVLDELDREEIIASFGSFL